MRLAAREVSDGDESRTEIYYKSLKFASDFISFLQHIHINHLPDGKFGITALPAQDGGAGLKTQDLR